MKRLFTLFLVLGSLTATAQKVDVLYVFPGQGSDERLFGKLNLEENFDVRYVFYPTPQKGETMKSFAQKISTQIDTTVSYSFIGTSIGGMLAVELNDLMSPDQTIIISSAKSKNELPNRYRFLSKVPIYKLFTGRGLLTGAKLMQPIVESDRNVEKSTFKSMLKEKEPKYMKRTVAMIMEWERVEYSTEIIHIHGDNDNTLPLKKVDANYIIEDGSHMMTLTRPKEIREILLEVLLK